MNGIPSTEQLQAWGLFLEAHSQVTDQLERELLAECQVPLTWYDVLLQIRQAPDERLRLQDLGQSVLLSKSGLTRRIDRMEAAGLVRREECPVDGRGVFAVLTSHGREVLDQLAPTQLRGVFNHFARHMSDEEAATLIRVFRRILLAQAEPGAGELKSACPNTCPDDKE